MSNIVQGQAPIVNFLNITHSFGDTDAVNHLLNNTSATSYANYTNDSSNMTGLYLSSSANKALYVFQQSNISSGVTNITSANITTSNTSITDMFALNVTASQVLRGDDLRFKITTPDSGVINEPNNNLNLSEIAPANQDDATALNNLRILNNSSVMATSPGTSVIYNTTNLQNALGVEGKAYYYTSTHDSFAPNYKAISSYDSMANNNILLSIDNLTENNDYTYEVVKVSTGDASFNFSSTQSGSSDVCIMKEGVRQTILGPYVTADMLSATVIPQFYLGGFLQSSNTWYILGSNNLSDWYLIDNRTSSTGSKTYYTPNGPYASSAYRYVRLVITSMQAYTSAATMNFAFCYASGNSYNSSLGFRNVGGSSDWTRGGGSSKFQDVGFYVELQGFLNGTYSGSNSTVAIVTTPSFPSVDANASQTYVGFVGSNNYTGLLGSVEMNKVYSSSLVISLSNGNNTQALSGGNANLIVNPTFVSIPDLTLNQVNNITFANSMSVSLTPSEVTLDSDANLPVPNPLVITQASESLPVGHELDNATLSFNSSNRSTINASNSYNLSAEVIYAVDMNTSLSNLTLENMQAPSVVRVLSVMQPATPSNPIDGNWTNSQGLNVFYDANFTTNQVSLQSVNTDGLSFIGQIEQVNAGDFIVNTTNNYNGSVLLTDNGSSPDFNLLTNNLHYGNTSGTNIVGTFKANYVTQTLGLDANDMRVILQGNNPLENATLSNSTGGGLTLTGDGIEYNYTAGVGIVTFNSNATFGAVSYKDFPNTTTYEQRYTLQFPQAGEVTNSDVYPESILLEAFDSNGAKLSNSLSNATMSIPLGYENWYNKGNVTNAPATVNISGVAVATTYTTLSYTIKVDLSLSGVVDGSVTLDIPILYTYDSGRKQWIGGAPPSLSFSIIFDSNQLATHNIILAAKNTNGDYINLNGAQPPFEKIDLRRGPYDTIVLSYLNYYNAIVNIYPQFIQDFSNIDYYIPITKGTDTTGGLSAEYWMIDDSTMDDIAALGYKGLTQGALATLVRAKNESVASIPMTVTLLNPGVFPAQYQITSGNLSFIYVVSSGFVDDTLYFVNVQNSIVQVDQPTTYNFMMSNNIRYLLDGTDGVYVTSNNINGVSSGSRVASVSLNKDKYSASVYDGGVVATNASIPDNGVLINGSTYSSFSLSTDILRGFMDGSSYTFSRGDGIDYEATYGSYNQTGTLTPAGSSPTNLVLNFGEGLGFSVNLVSNPLTSSTATFTVNKTSASAVYNGVPYNSQPSLSVKLTDMVNVGNAVPWIEMLALNNIFVPSNSATVQLVQPNIVVGRSLTYESSNDSQDAATVLAGFTYSQQQSLSDAALVSASYQINQDQVHLLYNSGKMLRPVGKTYYVTVAPVDVRIGHFVNPASLSSGYVKLTQPSVAYNVNVVGLPVPSKYNLNLNSALKVSSLKSSPPSASNFNYKSNLFTFEGVIIGNSNWHQYFVDVDITVPQTLAEGTIGYDQYGYTFTFSQYNNSIPHVIVVYWTNAFNRPIYNNDGRNYAYSPSLTIIPSTRSLMTQYHLGFVLNSSNVLIPQVRKYVSSLYDSVLDHTTEPNGFIQKINPASGSLLNFVGPTSVLDLPAQLPYKYGTSPDYPEPNTNNVSIASTVNLTGSNLPTYMDLIQVKDAPNVSGSVAYNRYIGDIISGDTNTRKILKVFAKDQLVIQDYAKNLSLRVGPNGRMYAGDISSYSLNLNDNLVTSEPVNGNFVPIYNSDVNLV